MRGKIFLDLRKNQLRKNGFPLKVSLSDKGSRKVFVLNHYVLRDDWDFEKNEPLNNRRLLFYVRKKKLQLDEILFNSDIGQNISLDEVKNILLEVTAVINTASFFDFFALYINELKNKGNQGNAESYVNALSQLKKFKRELDFKSIDYNFLNDFKNWRFRIGNSKNTIHTYLRKYRAVYNEAVQRKLINDLKPFEGVFKGVTVRSNRTKKKYLPKKTIVFLEGLKNLPIAQQRAIDLFLLQFYFGGQDLNDIYYLKKDKIINSRVFFSRGKLGDDGYQFDLKITPRAYVIIKKYYASGDYLFPWRKSHQGYKTFRDNMRRALHTVQNKYNIEIEPLRGKLGSKVARHTFATLGKQLFIESDLLRELMGHERNDVDTIYKDKYPEAVRDEALLKIIL